MKVGGGSGSLKRGGGGDIFWRGGGNDFQNKIYTHERIVRGLEHVFSIVFYNDLYPPVETDTIISFYQDHEGGTVWSTYALAF